MVQKVINICGKDVHLAYCYATEISFKLLAEEDIHAFVQESTKIVQNGRMPDIRKAMLLILSAATAYYESKEEAMPITDKDIMNDCSPVDFGNALGTVVRLYMEFYQLPNGEVDGASAAKGNKGKN